MTTEQNDKLDAIYNHISSFQNSKEIYIIKIQGNGVRGGNYIVDLFCIDSNEAIHNTTGFTGSVEGKYATLENNGYSSAYHFNLKIKTQCSGTLNGSSVSYNTDQKISIDSVYPNLTQFIWILSC